MSNVLILAPVPIAAVTVSRGVAATALLSPDPKEVWADSASGSAVSIDIDLGAARSIDTVFIGFLYTAAAGASWTITGGAAGYTTETLKAGGALRVPDVDGQFPPTSHAFWHGAAALVRYLRLSLTQPGGAPALTAGVVMVGAAFVASLGREWGAGRRPIDLSNVTPLPSGGFAIVEGARKRSYAWTFGDLTSAEAEQLEAIAMDRGESRPVLVVEDPAQTAGLRTRIHYGRFETWRAGERRNRVQTRWEVGIEGWV